MAPLHHHFEKAAGRRRRSSSVLVITMLLCLIGLASSQAAMSNGTSLVLGLGDSGLAMARLAGNATAPPCASGIRATRGGGPQAAA